MDTCPLCNKPEPNLFYQGKVRAYFQCKNCSLIFADKKSWLDPEEEKKVYDFHENSPEDAGYRNFLSRLFNPLMKKLKPGQRGLDFGCGSGPTLSVMFEEFGFKVELYDKYYADHPEVLLKKYDFIVSTEVFEHLYDPGKELKRLLDILRPGGFLGIMTKLAKDLESFKSWHYKNDPTHVCFYSRETFEWIANENDLAVEFIGSDVIILGKRHI